MYYAGSPRLVEKTVERTVARKQTIGERVASAEPVPSTAIGVSIDPKKGYFVEEIRDGLYWATEGVYQIMFLTTGKGVIVVDAPPTFGQNLLKAISEVTAEPITHVIYSHSHADHIGAASLYPRSATYISHEETSTRLQRARPFPFGSFAGGSPVPLPTVTFSDSYKLSVGSQTLELSYKGPVHEPGNIFIYAPEQKVLMLVDLIFPGWTPFKNLAMSQDIRAWIAAHDQALTFDFDNVIGGHLGRLGTRNDAEIQQEYVLDIQRNAAQALQTVDFSAIAQQTGFSNPWLLFDLYFDAVVDKCTDLTMQKWNGRLGGVDVFTHDHAFVMVESLRID